jgi:hypothetical protein
MFDHVCIIMMVHVPPMHYTSHHILQSKVKFNTVQTMHQVYLYILLYTGIYEYIQCYILSHNTRYFDT